MSNDGDQVVVLLLRPGRRLLGLGLSQRREGTILLLVVWIQLGVIWLLCGSGV